MSPELTSFFSLSTKMLVEIFSGDFKISENVFLPIKRSLIIKIDHLSPTMSNKLETGQVERKFMLTGVRKDCKDKPFTKLKVLNFFNILLLAIINKET